MAPRTKIILAAALLFSVCVGTYFNSLFYDFVFDDRSLVVDNPYIKSPKYIGQAFKKDLWDFAYEGDKPHYYRPLQTLSYMLDYGFWKLDPVGYHLTNTFLHLLNALLLFGLIYLLFNNFFVSLIGSLLFCSHPVNSSVVTYISGRGDLLAGSFILLTFLFSLLAFKFPKKQSLYFALAVLSSMSAFLSKESAVVIPFGIILLLFLVKGEKRNKALFFSLIVLSVFLYLYSRLMVLGIPFAKHIVLSLNPFLRLLNFLYLLLSYIFLLFVPVNLYLTHMAIPVLSWSDPRIPVVLTLFIAGLILWRIKRRNIILNFSLIWFLIFVFPVFLVMAGFSRNKLCMAENWIYIAAIGFYVVISYLLYILWSRRKTIAYCLSAVMLLTYITVSISNNSNFKDRISLASHMLRFDPENKEAHKELADAYLQKKEYANVLEHINQAIRLAPFDPDLYMIKGAYYEDTGNIKLAVDAYEKLLKIEPGSARANNNLGAVYFNRAEFAKARIYLMHAIELNPSLPEPYLNMAKLCQLNNQATEAIFFYRQAIKLNPDFEEAFVNLARIYLNKGDFNSAVDVLNKALNAGHKVEPVLTLLGIARFNMGIFYAKGGQFNKAIEIWQEGLRNAPGNKIIKENIDKARHSLRQGR